MTEGSIERYLQEQEYLRAKAAREAEENEKLKLQIALKELEMQSKESENLKQSQQNRGLEYSLNHNTIEFKEKLLEENVLSKRDLENHKAPIDRLAEKDFNWFRNVLCILAVTYYLIIFYLIYKLTWNVMEPLTYVLGSLPILLAMLYLIVFEKNFSPIKYMQRKKQKCYQQKYSEFNFDIDRLSDLYEKEKALRHEIGELKAKEAADLDM